MSKKKEREKETKLACELSLQTGEIRCPIKDVKTYKTVASTRLDTKPVKIVFEVTPEVVAESLKKKGKTKGE